MPHAQIHHLTKFGEDSIQNEEVVSKNVNVDSQTQRQQTCCMGGPYAPTWPYGQC